MRTKTLITILILLMAGGGIATAQKKKDNKKETVVFDVSMTCEKCQKRIEKNIAYEKGVTDMAVALPNKTVSVTYRKDKTSVENLQKAFEDLGYKASIHNGSSNALIEKQQKDSEDSRINEATGVEKEEIDLSTED